jgi:hypothetical protein
MLEDAIWRTSDGRNIKIKNLTDDHLLNIINYKVKRVERLEDAQDLLHELADSSDLFNGVIKRKSTDFYAELLSDDTFVMLSLEANKRGLM